MCRVREDGKREVVSGVWEGGEKYWKDGGREEAVLREDGGWRMWMVGVWVGGEGGAY